ncbi:hypothetical protein HQ520_08835, partial [bacterium]|nr:hypothetical protein [bacterium]
MIDWKYDGLMLENDPFTELGDDGSCTYLWPLGKNKHLLIFFSHRIYGLGEFDQLTITPGGDTDS